MIRVRRGREPAALPPIRTAELTRVRAIAAVRTPTSDDVGGNYQVVKPELWARQHHKCCYCEHICQFGFHDVEHYRPKARAERGPGFSTHGYWWLAWTWSNLMFSCPACNRSGKNDLFPLAPGSVALVAEEAPPLQEQPLLIDPAAESARSHIQYQPITKHGRPMWIPVGRTVRGRKTVVDLGLIRDELMELFESHANNFVMPVVERIQVAITVGNVGTIQQVWHEQAAPLVLPLRPYSMLSFDILDHHFPRSVRKRFGLELKLG